MNATESAYNVEDKITGDKYTVIPEGVTYAKLYQTQNIVFEAAEDAAKYTIDVQTDTDLGIGYLQFSANGHKNVEYHVQSAENKLLNSAGYVVDAGVRVDISLRNTDVDYMREWRKVGAGTLNLCGTGNNEIFLNVGGGGETLLNQKEGYYAAYNVLVNTGSVLRIHDAGQINRDLTFGNGGGTLDMNGVSMDWYTQGGETRKGFTINDLTEEAIITNEAEQKSVLTYKQGGSTHFVGSFRDSEKGSLQIVHDSAGTWELNGIRTQLNHGDSGLTVQQGTVRLAGTLTVHGYGSEVSDNGQTAHFSTREDDWHYADAAMNVTVEKGATFELASHARLTGDVTVKTGGTYVMHEGVNHAKEYLEGGEKIESTAGEIAKFYGHWGDVILEDGADMRVRYSPDNTDTATTYSGKVSGPGQVTIELGTDAAPFVMSGEVLGVESVNVVGKSRLQMGSTVTISALATGDATLKGVNKLSADSLGGTAEKQLSVNNAAIVVSENEKFTISNARLEDSFVDAGAGATLELSKVYVAASTKLTDDPATLMLDDTTIEVAIGTNTTAKTVTLTEPLFLETPGGTDKITVDTATEMMQLISTALNNYTLTGTSLTLDLSAESLIYSEGKLSINGAPVGNWLAVSFSDGTPVSFDKNLPVTLTFSSVPELSGVRLHGYYDGSSQKADVVYFRVIPEPATATLSLLALAALCSRRRRKE